MRKFCIQSKAGVICGIYEGDTPTAAFEAMVADVGDGYDVDGRRTAGTPGDCIIIEVVDVTHDPEHGVTFYTLENGECIAEDDPSRVREYEDYWD